MRRLALVAAITMTALAGCGGDAEKRAATTPDDSVVLGTDPVPTQTARAKRRPKPAAEPPEPERTSPASPEPAQAEPRTPGAVTVVGDSLAVGTESLLPAALPGWTVRTDARKGRTTAEGVRVLQGMDVPAGTVLALSLFTNDAPDATAALQAALRAGATKVGAEGCQVWATIARPGNDEPANDILRRLDGGDVDGSTVIVADWAELVRDRPALLAPDGVHATPEGYRARAQLYADAIRRCT